MARVLVEHQHRARDFSRLHSAECFVDVLEFAAARDHVVEVEPSLLIELDDARHVDAEAVRAHEASLDALLVQQREAVHVDFLPNRNHSDNRGDAAGGGARPPPPAPHAATLEPGATFAVFSAAPTPVITPHPISAARSSGTSSAIFTSAFSCSSIFSA